MNKIVIFYGSSRAFNELIPIKKRSLTEVVKELDSDRKKYVMELKGLPKDQFNVDEDEKPTVIEDFVIFSDEYSNVREHIITNFLNFIEPLGISNMYLQNPPKRIIEQLHRAFSEKNIIKEIPQEYANISPEIIRSINNDYDNNIIGQKAAKKQLLRSLYPLVLENRTKPVVMLFYGASGIGKTETAQYLAKLMNGKLLRKQFSMYQNNDFGTYLFGGKHTSSSFAKDLLDRDSNVILLDEFDKSNPVFHSAFYQLFDEGIYEHNNYLVDLKRTVIICTSNYTSIHDVKENLGDAIYNRFDAVIHFEDLSLDAKKQITTKRINEILPEYENEGIEVSDDVLQRLNENVLNCTNAREIKRLIEDVFSLVAVRQICEQDEEQLQ